jgi:hypothetical protein
LLAEELTVSAGEVLQLHTTSPLPDWLRQELGPPGFSKDRKERNASASTADREVTLARIEPHSKGQVLIGKADGTTGVLVSADPEQLDRMMLPGGHLICWVVATKGRQITVQTHSFAPAPFPEDQVVIGVNDDIADRIRLETKQERASFEAVTRWLIDEFSMIGLGDDPRRRVLHTGAPSEEMKLEKGFSLIGRKWAADVAFIEERFVIRRLTPIRNRRSERWPRFTSMHLRFTDRSDQAATSEAIHAALLAMLGEQQSYIELWAAYNEIERETLVEEARQLGIARFRTRILTRQDEVWSFDLQSGEESDRFLRRLQAREGEVELEVAAHPPSELGAGERSGRTIRGTVRQTRSQPPSVDLRLYTRPGFQAEEPPLQGVLFLAMSGSRTSQERRERARERIWSGNAEMPALAALIEGVGTPASQPRSLHPYKKILKRVTRDSNATEAQEKALELALTTPDLLLVQGPPGTGKTQFITALLRCLDEAGESTRAFNRTLITSYQHDAVDHMVSKSRSGGLPPARIDADDDRSLEGVEILRAEIKSRTGLVHQAMPEVSRRRDLANLNEIANAYESAPTTAVDLVDLLDRVERLAGDALPYELRRRLADQRAMAQSRTAQGPVLAAREHAVVVAAVRALRGEAVAFADDGPARAADAMAVLEPLALLVETDRDLLVRSLSADPAAEPALLSDLTELRIRLLERLGVDSTVAAPIRARDSEVRLLLRELVEAAEAHIAGTDEGVGEVLAEYLRELDGNVGRIQRTLRRYNAVLASTVQQADSKAMHLVMDAPLPAFGSIIVDEAARANPLDLMIPLSCARRRIVLVGDHKQLPHALEQKIERELKRTGSYGDTDVLHRSLFQRWFEMFREERPAIRTIRLNEQFRMHPELGRFVSSTFYGGPEAIKPADSTKALTHALAPYPGKVAGWLDVPLEAGPEERDGRSFRRPQEAKRIAEEVLKLADQDSGRDLSFGVISFYKSQVTAIWEALVDSGLAVPQDGDIGFQPVARMAQTADRRARLRVGTVDAFQGMEFDVVLLSVVRSSEPVDDPRPKAALRRYGHLTSDQRMCVAMSRQRRLLLSVGDAAMGDRGSAPPHPDLDSRSIVEGLTAFQELCKGPHGAGIRP